VKFEIQIAGRARVVELTRNSEAWRVALDGKAVDADVMEIEPGIFSILLEGKSHEVRVTRALNGALKLQSGEYEFAAEIADPRAWRGRRHGSMEAEGRQEIVAPMPGKVVRVLVAAGETVEAGQGLMVVEAMKMQNEVRSPKSGVVERLMVKEGQAVNAGEGLAVIA
jgi:biotin carboxyl carrier protein